MSAVDSSASIAAGADQASGRGPGSSGTGDGSGHGAADPVHKALAYILRSTQSRPQSEAEIAAKLRSREIPDDVAADAIARAKKIRAIDDEAFARAWVEDRGRQRGFGVARLRQELRRRQLSEGLIADALQQLDGRDDFTVAVQLARTRFRQLPASLEPDAAARRLAAFLARRGYPPALSQRAAMTVSGLDRRWD
ncbi:MAG TPA: regulatory protein RecX [Egibacteraceae bacterium]|nr:regulatory protein RecX [Egibacteraceae bacterium]